jgi:hypothetical protein
MSICFVVKDNIILAILDCPHQSTNSNSNIIFSLFFTPFSQFPNIFMTLVGGGMLNNRYPNKMSE